jgi:diaminopimelate epimerase
MQMHNSDGSEAEMCGNAVRCVGKFLFDKGLSDKTLINLETGAGIKVLELQVENGEVSSVRVDMGEPELRSPQIPLSSLVSTEDCIGQDFALEDFSSQITCVSMGNPHAVFFVDEIQDFHIHSLGPKIEVHEMFPNKTNVEFVKVLNKTELEMRVWERGAGETLACGTGAAAVCVAAALNGLSQRSVRIHLLGGVLDLEWAENNHVFKTGPASWSFEGQVNLAHYA